MGDLLHILWRLKVYVVAMVYLGSEHFCVSCADFEEFEENNSKYAQLFL
jgi:hypothetical protein